MNRIYRLVFNHALGQVQVTSEIGASPGTTSGSTHRVSAGLRLTPLALGLLLSVSSLGAVAQSLPSGGQIVSGSGQIGAPGGNQLTINQASNKLAINWDSFNIGAGQKVTFNQPDTNAIALNRVIGIDGSRIMGQLDANGRVFLVNPNGVLFGASAQVNVGGLVASSLGISDADFAAGNYRFKGEGSNAAVINHGTLNATAGGTIALLGGRVSNHGVIVANQGSVALAAGNAMTLDFAGNGLLNLQVDEATLGALVENHQLIQADGGQVLLTADAGEALLNTVVNNTGVIQARTLDGKDGRIVLLGSFDGGTVQVAGTLDASAPDGGNGGFIETSGAHVKIADGTTITTKARHGRGGTWLIDPTDIIIGSGGTLTGATLAASLENNGNVTLDTSGPGNTGGTDAGNITINDAVAWNSGSTLTLKADHNIQLNAAITASNGGLTFDAANTLGTSANGAVNVGTFTLARGNWNQLGSTLPTFSAKDFRLDGGTFLRAQSGDGSATPWQLIDIYGLQGMSGFLDKNFSLADNLDASGTANWNGGQGFNPIGTNTHRYSGIFDGMGHSISGLTIHRPNQDHVGLFGHAQNATLRNIGLLGGRIEGASNVGGLVGSNFGYGGGTASISNAYATGQVTGVGLVGGLVGSNFAYGGTVSISNAYATGQVAGNNYVGGLVGGNFGNYGTTISISNAYATGQVTGVGLVGGLVGAHDAAGGTASISNAYATGAVSGSNSVGGLVGLSLGSVTHSFYATTGAGGTSINSGGSYNSVGEGKTLAELKQQSTFAGWSLDDTGGTGAIWRLYEGATTPLLRSFLKGVTVTVDAIAGKTYDGSRASGNFTYITNQPDAVLNGNGTYTSNSANAGTYNSANGGLVFGGLYSGQQGYDISYDPGSLTITRKALTVTGVTAGNKIYDGTTNTIVSGGTLNGLVSGETLSLSGMSGAFADKNAGTGKAVTVSGATLTDGTGLASNYTVSDPIGVTGNITPKALTITGLMAFSKVYDGTVSATLTGGTLDGLVGAETLGLSGLSGAFADKNVGQRKTVTFSGGTLTDGTGLASNYTVSNPTGLTADISKATITSVTGLSALDKIYNGNLNVSLSAATAVINGKIAGDDLQLFSASGAFTDKNAGSNKTVNISGITLSGSDLGNYNFLNNSATATANITPKALTITGVTAGSKVYDGSTSAVVMGGILNGLISGETLSLSGLSGAFADKNAGNGKTVTVSGATLADGTGLASNYRVIHPTNVTANINKATITSATNLVVDSKVYDGTTNATINTAGATFNGMISGDSLAIGTATGAFSDKNAGTGKTVTVSGITLGGTDAGNYNLTNVTATGTGTITPKALTIVGMSVINKVYDGTTKATLAGGSVVGLVGSENIGVTGLSATFDDKNAGTGKTATATGATLVDGINGGLAANYTISNPTGLIADITPKALTVTGVTAITRAYDGTLAATLSGGSLSGLVSGETLVVSGGTGTFADKNAGTGKAVTVTGVGIADGTGLASNYTVSNPTGVTGTITQKALTVTGALAADKTYDGTRVATITGGTLSGMVGSETLNLGSLIGEFSDKNAGSGKAVSVTGGGLSDGMNGGLARNYSVGAVTGLSASIAQKALTLSGMVAANKMYDGTTNVTLTGGTLNGLVAGETLGLSGLSGAFADKNAGTAKVVTVSGARLSDDSGLASNYTLSTATGLTADITPKALTVTGMTAATRAYDGTVAATLSGGSLSGLVGDETLVMSSGTGVFADKNVGTGKAVTVTGVGIADGTGLASNYTVNTPTGVTGDITPKVLSLIGLNALNKVYDGTTAAILSGGGLNGLVGNETLGLSGLAGTFDSANAGTGKAITVTAALTDGSNGGLASNYRITPPSGLTADIGKAGLTITANNGGKRYGQNGGLNGYSTAGLIHGDTVSKVDLASNGSTPTAHVGNYTITASNADGAGLSNYDITYADGVLSIGKAGLTITANNATKSIGREIALDGYHLEGLLNGDRVDSVSLSSAGTGQSAAPGEYTIVASNAAGNRLSNYDISYINGTLQVEGIPTASVPEIAADVVATQSTRANPAPLATGAPSLGLKRPDTFTIEGDGLAPEDQEICRMLSRNGDCSAPK